MISKHIIVSGQVQGVGFRYYTLRVAAEMMVIGWVRNLYSGQVEILVSTNTTEEFQEFIAKIKVGPQRARVEKIEIFDVDSHHIQGHTFEVREDGETQGEF